MPGGRVEKGERFDKALEREVIEECGVHISIAKLLTVEDKRYLSPTNEAINLWLAVFQAYVSSNETIQVTADAIKEGLRADTFSVDHLPAKMILKDKEKIENYLSLRSDSK